MNTPITNPYATKNVQEELILEHMGLVKRVALHLKARLSPFMDLDELIQVGMIGLIEAAKSFDASKGIAFENFAHRRVKGSIIDEVRKLSYLPRSAVAINKQHNESARVLSASLGRAPSQAELADSMGKEIDDFQKERGQAARFETVHLEDLSEHVLNIPDEQAKQPDTLVEETEFINLVVDAIDELPDREKLVMSLYYQDELNLKEIGEVLGVSESRVSQILSSNVKKLRNILFKETEDQNV